ncbi:SUMF1/EgtB/PvdO family nonheme iron enzyme [Crocosphaera watsonii]|uniref:SUMF1/EgtB/PvdO family nonheme iron enzyme n=1 Tax=Crocosphaera watsonii TaxID=263511 RepID=UPI000906E11C|nr:SUMF1/EgtB/PvdO family nonheme iron enzyme [Crocosphaera watsonii]
MLRGGSWNNNPSNCRSANRNNNDPGNRNNNIGFRVVVVRRAILGQNQWMGIYRVCKEKSRSCSCGNGDISPK